MCDNDLEIVIIQNVNTESNYHGVNIPAHKFYCMGMTPIGVVQLVHGLTENHKVYTEMGRYFAQHGYIFIVHDVLGHGEALIDNTSMYLPDGGWKYAAQDIESVYQQSTNLEEKKLPRSIIGFSMGSFLVRSLLSMQKISVDNVVLVGTGNKSNIELAIGNLIASREIKLHGDKCQSELVNNLAMDSNDKYFKNTYKNAWLYKDTTCAMHYNNDDSCYKYITPSFFRELLRGMKQSKHLGYLAELNPNIILLSGEKDIVTRDMKKLVNSFRKKGCRRVYSHVISNYRHAILSDTCKQNVWSIIMKYISTT